MSGSLPTSPDFSSYRLRPFAPSSMTMTQSGRRFVDKLPGHIWHMQIEYPLLDDDEAWILFAFAAKQRGKYGTFSVALPKTNRGAYGGTPLVNGASQTGLSLVLDGATPSVTGWSKAGDFINIAGTNKTYMVTDDADSDISGNVTLNLMANLMESPANNAAITTSGVTFNMSFLRDELVLDAAPGAFYGMRVDLVEAL